MRGTITTAPLNWRATPDERGTVERAAALTKQTMSDVMRAATLEYAARVIGTVKA